MHFDARWLKSGGIGRFCSEIMKSPSLENAHFIDGDLNDALSPKDMISLSRLTMSGHYFISPGYNCPLFSFNKAIITLHDLMHLNFPEYLSFRNKVYYQYVVKRVVQSAPLVFTVSNFTRDEISDWACIPKEKVVVVPNGIDHDRYHFHVKPIKRSRPYFFYVGNNKPHKNLPRLIEAFSLLKEDTVDLLLSCPATEELSGLVVELGLVDRVIFLSWIDEEELPSHYKGAIATVMATFYEGFGLPILESMAVGIPVITSNITAMPEVAGGAAMLVDPYSVNSIQQAMTSMIENREERNRLTILGLKRAKDFSWDKSRELWDQALNNVIKVKDA